MGIGIKNSQSTAVLSNTEAELLARQESTKGSATLRDQIATTGKVPGNNKGPVSSEVLARLHGKMSELAKVGMAILELEKKTLSGKSAKAESSDGSAVLARDSAAQSDGHVAADRLARRTHGVAQNTPEHRFQSHHYPVQTTVPT